MTTTTRFSFTKTRLEKLLLPDSGRETYHDTLVPGLILRVSASGSKAFAWYRKVKGRPMRLTIGSFPATTVEQARRRCQRWAGEVAEGGDPQGQRAADRAEPTLADLWTYWTVAKGQKRSLRGDQYQYDRFLKRWAARKLSAIGKAHVQALHAKIGQDNGIYAANRLLSLLASLYAKAPDQGYRGDNPAKGVEKFKEQSRDRFLQADELPRFFAALAREREPFADFFGLCLLTGGRRGNIQTMQWTDLNLEAGLWRIPAEVAKAGEVIVVPLLPQAVEILQRRREAANDSPWVFPSWGKTGHLTEVKAAWGRILKRAGLSDLRVHDLRRSVGSWMATAGVSLLVIGKALGHRTQAASAVYARLQLDPVRAAMTAGAQAMLEAAEKGSDDGR